MVNPDLMIMEEPRPQYHVFLVMQYLDKEENTCYRILQSFLRAFDFQTDFNRNRNFLTQEECNFFSQQMQNLYWHKEWTAELEEFYTKFFYDSGIKVGMANPFYKVMPLFCGTSFTFQDVLRHDQRFAAVQETDAFQRMMQNCIRLD